MEKRESVGIPISRPRAQVNEADTCWKFVVLLLQAAGWDNNPHSSAEQRYFTKGSIVVRGNEIRKIK